MNTIASQLVQSDVYKRQRKYTATMPIAVYLASTNATGTTITHVNTESNRNVTSVLPPERSVKSVSYTHLDVYKRQALNIDIPIPSLLETTTSIDSPNDDDHVPIAFPAVAASHAVSYTHLDVYKRQVLWYVPSTT